MEINLKTDSEIFLTDDYEIFANGAGKEGDLIQIGIGGQILHTIVSGTGIIHFFIPENTEATEIVFENLTRTAPKQTICLVRPMARMMLMAEPMPEKVINYLTVDEPTRRITVPEQEKIIGAQFEKDAEEKWFKIPRFVDNNLDLSQTAISIVYKNANKLKHEVGETKAQNVVATENEVTFKWVVPGGATNYEGEILFLVKATKVGTKTTIWSTTVAKGIVEKGLNTDNLVPEPADKETVMLLLEKIKAEGDRQVDRVTGAGNGQIIQGEDGYSPTAKVVKSGNKATITITDKNGTTTATITDGKDGAVGPQGPEGKQGPKGLTGKTGPQGDIGPIGPQGPKGADGANGKTPIKGIDYYTELEKQAFVQDVLNALPKWTGGEY